MRLSRVTKIVAALLALFLAGITLSAQVLVRHEEKKNLRDIQDRGTYLISLLSLYPLKDFAPERRGFFLRTLAENTSHQGLLYLFIHDENGKPLISVAPPEIASRVPENVQSRSIYTGTLLQQSYQPSGLPYTVYEFAKPIYEGSKKGGTVRLGLRLPAVTIFSLERISLMAMISFFIFAALFVAYYGMVLTLRSMKTKYRNTLTSSFSEENGFFAPETRGTEKIMPILKELEESLNYSNNKLNDIKDDNIRLMSKLGVIAFEKNQIINVLDSINFGIIVTDLQDNITFINDYMLKLVNAQRQNTVNKKLEEIFRQEEVRQFILRFEMAEPISSMNSIETSFPDQAPGEVFLVSLSLLTTDERTAIGKMVLVRNVTSISIAKRTQQEFIAHVAHELMTPLSNIRAYSEMLMDDEAENEEMQKEFYNIINQETKRLTSIIQNLLNISRMEMGNLTLDKGVLRTEWLVDDCLSTIEASAQAKKIIIEKHMPDILPSFMADKELLKTAIINIVGNAVKYTPENGKIVFSMDDMGSAIIFDVADTGYGMAQEEIPRVFEKFFRSNNPEIRSQAGTGLGLAIAYEIVHLHGGDIEVQSKLGEGSRFTIKIPKEEYTLGK